MKSTVKFVSALLAIGVVGILPARADGDAAAGKKVFNKCMACHDAMNDKDKVGPSLVGVIGRKAGTRKASRPNIPRHEGSRRRRPGLG